LTWPPRISQKLSPSTRRRKSGTGRGGFRILPAAVAILLLALLLTPSAGADAGIKVVSTENSFVFSQSLTFSLEARASSPIVDVVLFYGRDGDRLVRRIYPDYTPGREIRVEHVEELESGQFAPGTLLRSWWQLTAEDGTIQTSEPEVLEYLDDNHAWRTLAGQRVDLFWYGSDEDGARELLAAAEEAVARLEGEIGVGVDQRPRVYVYDSQRDMSRALYQRSETYDDHVLTLGVRVDEDTVILLGTHRDAHLTLAHELSHVVVGIATDNPYTDLPRWLDEGLAMYAEGQLPIDNQQALESGIRRDELLSIRSMTSYSGRAELVDLYYGEVYSVVEFMLDEWGREKMQELLEVFSEGTRQEEALVQVYGFGLDELDARWRASLGLPRRESPEEQQPPSPAEEQPRPEKAPACSYSIGAVLLSAVGCVLSLRLDRSRGAG